LELHTRCHEPRVGHADLEITAVDVGVYAGKCKRKDIYISEPRISCLIFQPVSVISWRTDVNANQLSGINMGSLGRFGYLFVNNTENSGSHETLSRERH